MIRILIVDDQEMIRVGLRTILESQSDMEVVADVSDGLRALEVLSTEQVDVVLLDLRMPGMDGVQTTSRIRESEVGESVRIVILTTFDQDENVLAALRAGANGFLSKGVTPAELLGAVRDVVAGGGALSPAAARALIEHVNDLRSPGVVVELAARFDALTARERDVVAAIARGRSNDEIAAEMFVSPYTVKTHASRAMLKVGARDRAQLVSFALLSGLPAFRPPE
ncbi:response regulator [Agromyces sp. SYSU T0242]|uniref:response regulator n=1 Tax=Agromyces litoreus TaxID=3158561 RepID=UPI00339A4774